MQSQTSLHRPLFSATGPHHDTRRSNSTRRWNAHSHNTHHPNQQPTTRTHTACKLFIETGLRESSSVPPPPKNHISTDLSVSHSR